MVWLAHDHKYIERHELKVLLVGFEVMSVVGLIMEINTLESRAGDDDVD